MATTYRALGVTAIAILLGLIVEIILIGNPTSLLRQGRIAYIPSEGSPFLFLVNI